MVVSVSKLLPDCRMPSTQPGLTPAGSPSSLASSALRMSAPVPPALPSHAMRPCHIAAQLRYANLRRLKDAAVNLNDAVRRTASKTDSRLHISQRTAQLAAECALHPGHCSNVKELRYAGHFSDSFRLIRCCAAAQFANQGKECRPAAWCQQTAQECSGGLSAKLAQGKAFIASIVALYTRFKCVLLRALTSFPSFSAVVTAAAGIPEHDLGTGDLCTWHQLPPVRWALHVLASHLSPRAPSMPCTS